MNYQGLNFLFKITQSQTRQLCRRVVATLSSRDILCTNCESRRLFASGTESYGYKDTSLVQNVMDKIKLSLRNQKIKSSGYLLYEAVADNIDYGKFMTELEMPDTFHSWFLVTELHVWMLMARIMSQPTYGRKVRNSLVEALWKDVCQRAKKLGSEHAPVIKGQVMQLFEEFQAALVSYDEGLLGDDVVLAGAIWRRILGRRPDPRLLEAIITYIRQTMFLLEKMDTDDLLLNRKIDWIPLEEILKKLP